MQRKLLKTIFLVLLVAAVLPGQILRSYRLDVNQDGGYPDRPGIVGNAITDLLWKNGTLYAGTGFGLSTTTDNGVHWQNWTPVNYGGKGGISAITVTDDGTVWIATAYDTTVQNQSLPIGGGLRFLRPGEDRWHFIPQPVDARDDTAGGKKPTTTRVQNVTFDIAVLDTQIWIASFGGGVRRSLDGGKTWEVVTTDGLPFSALNYLNHRGFSLLVENGHIWVGTADGISLSTDGGTSWRRFTHQNQLQPISGNWVIALAYNPYDNSVWAATLKAEGEDEFNAISRTRNSGETWEVFLKEELSDGTFPRYIAFYDSAVYVATEKGIYKTIDDGRNWFKLPAIYDTVNGESITTSVFYSVATSPAEAPFHRLWVGSRDGLATTPDNGNTWTIFRSFVSTRERPQPAVYAYPNPYSPSRQEAVRFQYDIRQATSVTIDIFNFAMERVITLRKSESAPAENTYDRSLQWNGRDSNGRMVDNGVYFFRARVGNRTTWGKIVIVN